MIVADVNLVSYLLIQGDFTPAARNALARDPNWVAPAIWRHEFLNVLATSVRKGWATEAEAELAWANAPSFVQDSLLQPPPMEVLKLSVRSHIATYDCIYVVLARNLGVRLVTGDKKLVERFKDVAMGLEEFAAGR